MYVVVSRFIIGHIMREPSILKMAHIITSCNLAHVSSNTLYKSCIALYLHVMASMRYLLILGSKEFQKLPQSRRSLSAYFKTAFGVFIKSTSFPRFRVKIEGWSAMRKLSLSLFFPFCAIILASRCEECETKNKRKRIRLILAQRKLSLPPKY
jgi:hypothetical protein